LPLTPNPSPIGRGELVAGRLYGPSLFPQTLETVYSAAKLGLPIIGAGGVWTKENADAMLSAGALAVQVDAAFWSPGFTFLAPVP
jgi:dihydroorotate dehydrogenase